MLVGAAQDFIDVYQFDVDLILSILEISYLSLFKLFAPKNINYAYKMSVLEKCV